MLRPVGFWTLSVKASAPAICGTVARARILVPEHKTKAHPLVHTCLGAHPSRDDVARSEMLFALGQQSTCQTARTAISRGYTAQGQVLESTIGLAVRPKGFGQSLTTYTRTIWRKSFGADALLWLT